jgi:SAM-dependent methyltransferase
VTAWDAGALTSPLSGAFLYRDAAHSLAAEGVAGERWPVIEDIPFLRADRAALARDAVELLDAGNTAGALVLLLGDQDNWARTPSPPEADRARLVAEVDRLAFRDACALLGYGPVGTYFAHRWTDPTYLSGLALAEAYWPGRGSVFELACGPGHFLGAFARRGAEVAGADIVFSKLWLARRFLAPGARLACFDAAAPWPLEGGAFPTVFCHDALYFLPEKAHVARECLRVAGPDGRVLVGHAHNRLVDNLSAGAPLAPGEYAGLFGAAALYDDRELTAALVEARAPRPTSAAALSGAPAVALAAGSAAAEAPRPVVAGLAVPPPGTRLRRNPLYGGDGAIHWPSERYEREYGPLATYPPRAEDAPAEAVAGASAAVDALARRRVLVHLPERW